MSIQNRFLIAPLLSVALLGGCQSKAPSANPTASDTPSVSVTATPEVKVESYEEFIKFTPESEARAKEILAASADKTDLKEFRNKADAKALLWIAYRGEEPQKEMALKELDRVFSYKDKADKEKADETYKYVVMTALNSQDPKSLSYAIDVAEVSVDGSEPHEPTFQKLAELMDKNSDNEVRHMILQTLQNSDGTFKSEGYTMGFTHALDSPSEVVKGRALEHLTRYGNQVTDSKTLFEKAKFLIDDKSKAVSAEAIVASAVLCPDDQKADLAQAIAEKAKSEDAFVRSAVGRALGELAMKEHLPVLLSLLEDSARYDVSLKYQMPTGTSGSLSLFFTNSHRVDDATAVGMHYFSKNLMGAKSLALPFLSSEPSDEDVKAMRQKAKDWAATIK